MSTPTGSPVVGAGATLPLAAALVVVTLAVCKVSGGGQGPYL